MKQRKTSSRVIRRLPKYLRQLRELSENGVDHISSGELSARMGLTASQIRQDFSCFGEFGQQGYGYPVGKLLSEISSILGAERHYPAVLVGAGNLGRALAANFDFRASGYRLLSAFDSNPSLVGSSIGATPVRSMEELPDFIRRERILAAVLTVPRPAAREVAGLLRDCGVRAICNFTSTDLGLQNTDILVEDVLFSDSFLTLSYYLTELLRMDPML